jgi:hypothetical protein
MKEEIKITVEKDGTVTVKVEGSHGAQCLSATGLLEKEMGKVLERRRTGDYYKVDRVHLRNTILQKDER